MRIGQLTAFGCGYVATALARALQACGVRATGTTRSRENAEALAYAGISPVIWPPGDFVPEDGGAWLVSVPPDAEGCPVERAFGERSGGARWIGYLSTTGVYGDLAGRWAFEETPTAPLSQEARNRVRAEDRWRARGACIFRLPGIYGPGRSAIERVLSGEARAVIKPGQVFSRVHRDDIVSALIASMEHAAPGRVYNICDDEPCGAEKPLFHAADLLGLPPPASVPFSEAALSGMARRFYSECKRVSNARAKAELGWRPLYPTYREGLAACLQAFQEAQGTESSSMAETSRPRSEGRESR